MRREEGGADKADRKRVGEGSGLSGGRRLRRASVFSLQDTPFSLPQFLHLRLSLGAVKGLLFSSKAQKSALGR